ncbi:MAG TPA: response regulator [bacterium]|nr:response regulator [bacterium]
MLKASRRARDLVDHIQTFGRQREEEMKPTGIGPIVEEVLKLLRASLPTTVEIQQDIEANVGNVLADSGQIHQVLMNLATNAAQAMEEKGGCLGVCLSQVDIDQEFADHHPDIDPGPHLKLAVSDTGCGMEPDVKERIFDPYFTTKEKDKGTGLGLATVHGIVKSHKGLILVYSEPGKYTTITVYLPVMEGETITNTRQNEAAATGSECILLIDDERVLVNLGTQMLEKLGYEVVGRTSSFEALQLFRTDPERFDLVITDMTMPKMSGDELAEELLRIKPGTPIILCTGFSEKMTEKKAEAIGIRAFLNKPVLRNDLAGAIRRLLD